MSETEKSRRKSSRFRVLVKKSGFTAFSRFVNKHGSQTVNNPGFGEIQSIIRVFGEIQSIIRQYSGSKPVFRQ